MKQPESEVSAQIYAAQSKYGLVLFRNQRQVFQINGRWTQTGFMNGASDLVGCQVGSGRMVCIEVKATGKKPNPKQELFLNAMLNNGCIAFYADSFKMFEEKLKTF